MGKFSRNKVLFWILVCSLLGQIIPIHAQTQDEMILKWAQYFSNSVLTEEERIIELRWFVEVTEPFRGRTIRAVAENIETHFWERDVLALAFEELTGIHVEYDIIGEGSVVESLTEQQQRGIHLYDIYVNDADMVGTHMRTHAVVNLTEYMETDGAPYTNPYLRLDDFRNLEFGQDYDGNLLQLPDQHFANLYWFRYDWFTDPIIQSQFEALYGYPLGVPINWEAYQDIAHFFTYEVRGTDTDAQGYINGVKIYGHLDYGRKSPSLGWRFTDAWLSIAGVGDVGLPNGMPVDEWGIRAENGIPVGASVARGGATNGPAAVYALETYITWLEQYAPAEARDWTWVDAGVQPARGDIAQRIFQYTTWLSDERFHAMDSPVTDANGAPLWRVAPTPHGRYWDDGMKVGYQDAGSWTIPRNITGPNRAMAWLWAQFAVSQTVSVDKFIVGVTPVRRSTVFAPYLTEHAAQYGGLVEFYRSVDEEKWTDTGLNVPDYPQLSSLWWDHIADAIAGTLTPQQAMDRIAFEMDDAMGQMQMTHYSPVLNPLQDEAIWLDAYGAPKPERPPDTPQTIPYDDLLAQWKADAES